MSSQESREPCFEDRPGDACHPETAQAEPQPLLSAAMEKDDQPEVRFPTAGDADRASRSDENAPEPKKDHFAPPAEPCECHCLHCGRTFMSNEIWFQKIINDPQGCPGFWMCPTPNCSGAGFTFDLFPTDPAHPANEGWHYDDDDEDEADCEFDPAAWEEGAADELEEEPPEYDPAEPKYKELDEFFGGEDDDDLEGEEWKYGLQPGERPPSPSSDDARQAWEREQQMYDEPDQRPRTLDWSNREDRKPGNGGFSEEDIPF
jgi:hypothetical protein